MMRRNIVKTDAEAGQDSFLDVVSNIVGILIILVVVVGARVKSGFREEKLRELAQQQNVEIPVENEFPVENALPDLPVPELAETTPEVASAVSEADLQKANAELELAIQQETALRAQIEESLLNAQRLAQEQVVMQAETARLETGLQLVKKELESFTDEKDVARRELILLRKKSLETDQTEAMLRAQLESVQRLASENGGPKKIEHKTTPIIRTVNSREFHFILEDDRIMYVPLDELLADYQRRMTEIVSSLMRSGQRTEVLGPYSGFQLHTETKLAGGSVSVFWKVLPPSIQQQGETVSVALAPVSQFRHYLEKLDPSRDILTFWIYPSGFASLPQIKEEVQSLGFSLALRPLPEGTPIAGSPQGQKSVAQ